MMISFKAPLKKFGEKGEKTGWTYVEVPASVAVQLHSENKRSFRVKGKINECVFEGIALVPAGGGDYIFAVNAGLRKCLKKKTGETVNLQLQPDHSEPQLPAELYECLELEPAALEYFSKMKKGERNYFIKWILSARTDATLTKRMALAINAFLNKTDFGSMIRSQSKNRTSG